MTLQEANEGKKLSRDECWKLVNEAVDAAIKFAHERVFTHPFTQELKAGTLPMECIKGWMLNSYAWALEINMSLPYQYYLFHSMLSQRTDLFELLSDRYADEFSSPVKGGHQRMMDALGKALGIELKELKEYQQIPAMRGMLDANVWNLEVNTQFGVANTTEEWYGKFCGLFFESLTKNYGISKEDAHYFAEHAEADAYGDHEAGKTIGHEVMGHAEGNRYITVRLLEDGLVQREGLRETILRMSTGEPYANFLDAIYYTYHPDKKLSDLEQTRR